MNGIPSDPIILLSYVNTKLRDECPNLDEFCAGYDVDRDSLCKKLAAAGYSYNETANQFV